MYIHLKDISLSLPHRTLFENFSTVIEYGSRIAVIGSNGVGKSSLIKIIVNELMKLKINSFSYVPQIIDDYSHMSGGQRFNRILSEALSTSPDILLLDEPTNHLDENNRKSLIKMLKSYKGTLIIATHDEELLSNIFDTFWHIDDGLIRIHKGRYRDLINENIRKRASIEHQLHNIKKDVDHIHNKLMTEQKRAAKSHASGTNKKGKNKWPSIIANNKKSMAQQTVGKKQSTIQTKKNELQDELNSLHISEVINPKFCLNPNDMNLCAVVSIANGSVNYGPQTILKNINIILNSESRLSIRGDNGVGKSTLVRAIMNDESITRMGDWYTPRISDIGYLDQHYDNLLHNKTVYENISHIQPLWQAEVIRKHLNDFLFRKNEEINTLVFDLSGGEKVRLSLCCIAANTPKLLILDEVTNNLDILTKNHVIEVLKAYNGAMILISHDQDFITKVGINTIYDINKL